MDTLKLNEIIGIYRKRLGLTQAELAATLGVTNQSVSKWESAQCCPDIYLLPKLAAVFGISMDELFGEERGDFCGQPPFRDDDTIRVVMVQGRQILTAQEMDKPFRIQFSETMRQHFKIEVFGNIECHTDINGDVECSGGIACGGDINGEVICGGNLACGDVNGDIYECKGSLCCEGTIYGSVIAGGDLSAGGAISGAVNCGNNVSCAGAINGAVNCGDNVTCSGSIEGDVQCGSNVECFRIGGNVECQGDVIYRTE